MSESADVNAMTVAGESRPRVCMGENSFFFFFELPFFFFLSLFLVILSTELII
jgi:hypothetical protein